MPDTFDIDVRALRGPAGAEASPGGSSGAVQYNNAGSFGGLSGLTLAAGVLKSASFTGGTATAPAPMISLAQTWNDAGSAFGAIDVNITNTASDYSSYFIRGRVGGVDRFRVTREEMVALGPESGTGSDTMIGFRRVSGGVIGICSGRNSGDGRGAQIVNFYWENGIGGSGVADNSVAVIRADNCTNRLSIESSASIIHIAETGRYEWEVGPTTTDGYAVNIFYEKGSAAGRRADFRNFGQSSYADTIVSFTSDTDAVDLVRFDHMAGSTRTTRGKVDALGNATFVTLKVGSNQVVGSRMTGWTAPTGTATRSTFATSTVTLPQLAQALKALIDDLTTHGLIGT